MDHIKIGPKFWSQLKASRLMRRMGPKIGLDHFTPRPNGPLT